MVKIAPVMIILLNKCNIINPIVVMESCTKHQRFLSRKKCEYLLFATGIVVLGVVVVVGMVGVVVGMSVVVVCEICVAVDVVVVVVGVVVVLVGVVVVVLGVVENRPLYQ